MITPRIYPKDLYLAGIVANLRHAEHVLEDTEVVSKNGEMQSPISGLSK